MKTQKTPALILVLLAALLLWCPSGRAASKVLPLSLSFSSTNSGTIALPGQQDRFTFTGTVGQRLFYDALDIDSDNINARLVAPNGSDVFVQSSSTDRGPFYLTEGGVYTLLLDGGGDAVGDYSFMMLDLANAPTLTLGVGITNSLRPQSQSLFYRFNGTAGQRLLATNFAASGFDATWALYGPANQLVFNQGIGASPGEVVLPVTGSYLLAFIGTSDAIGSLDFQARLSLVSNASGGTSGFGTVRSGTTTFDQTNTFTYTAPAGTMIYFDALTNNSPVNICLYDPTGTVVPGFCLGSGQTESGPFLLPRSGNYRLEVVGQTDGTYNFRLLDLNANATALTFGTTYTQTLNPGFRTDVYRFTGAAGQRIFYDALDGDGDTAWARLFHPNGGVVFFGNSSAGSDQGFYTLAEPGTYLLMLENYTEDNTVDYSFRMLDATQSPVTTLALDTTISGRLNPGTEVDWYRFNGTPGQRLYFAGASTNTGGNWYLFDPQNQYLSGNGLAADFEQVLSKTGTYLLGVFNNSSETNELPYAFRVITSDSATNALVFGTTYSGAIVQPGDEVRYTFTGTAGQRLHYDALDMDSDGLFVSLYNPAGSIILINGSAESDSGPHRLTDSGSYTLVFRGQGAATGSFRFRLIELTSSPVQDIAFDTTVNGALNPGSETDWYRFNGTIGQRLYFDGADTNTAGSWVLIGPNNDSLNGNGLAAYMEQTLPASGTYLLALFNNSTNPTPYSIRIVTPNTTTQAYVLGTSITNTLTEAAEERRYTFAGTAGQRLFYDALEADGDPIAVYLLDPNGLVVHINANADTDVGIFTLLQSGTYTLLFKGVGEVTGDFRFRLLDITAAPAITYGAPVASQLNPQIETDLYRINGTAGQRISITNIAASGNNASWYLVAPNNTAVLGQNIGSDLGEYSLPISGTYVIAILGQSDLIGTLDYQFRVSLLSTSNGTPSGFGIVRSGTTTAGQTNTYTFNGTAGLPVYFDYLSNVYVACYQLLAPNGEQVVNFCTGNDANSVFFLPTNGTYTLHVLGQSDGDFRFRLLNLAGTGASNLTFGTTYTQTLNPGFRTDVYRFTGTVGQRLVYDSLEYELDAVTVRLFSPSGDNIVLGGNADSEPAPFTVVEPGIYYLAFEGAEPEPTADYRFRIIDAAQPPATALAFNTVINGNLNPGTRSDVYRFNGTNGQRLYFAGDPTNGPGVRYLYGPANQQLGGANQIYDFEATLPATGEYLLVVGYGNDTNPAPYSIRVLTVTDTTNAISFGLMVTGTVSSQGQSRYYTFNGTVGQRIYYDALDYDFDGINARLITPSGVDLFNQNADSEGPLITLPETGTYRLVVYFAGTTSDFAFRLLDGNAAPVFPYDTVVTNVITNAYGAVLYQLPTTPNLRLLLDQLGSSENGNYAVYDPLNITVAAPSLGSDTEFTPTLAGQHFVIVGSASSSPVPYSMQIIPGNHAPVLALVGNRSILEESNFTFTAVTTDTELPNDVLTWSLDAGAPAGAAINPLTGVFSWTPTEAQGSNTYTVTLRVRDDGTPSFEDSETFTMTVNEVNRPPVLTLPSTQTINELAPLNVSATATDPDLPTNTLTFALVSGPTGVNVAANGAITWTPTEAQGPGTYPITVRVTDFNPLAVNATSLSTTGTFNVVVNEINVPPTFTGPGDLTLVEETPLNATATASDTDVPSNPLTFSLISGPSGLSIAANGVISWTPTEAQGSNVHSVSIRVTDNNTNAVNTQQLSATNTFNITVLESNKPPVLTVPSTQIITEETPLNASASATDPDSPANPLAFSLVSPPAGLTINSSSGALSWTPTEAQGSNSYVITVVVTDTNLLAINAISISVTNTFTIVVNESNRPPVLNSPGPQTVTEETLLNVTITGTDPDLPANGLTFGLLSPPAGMTINPSSGLISWTPSEVQGPSNHVITITVTDTNALAINPKSFTVTNTFTVNVLESNRGPVLTVPTNQVVLELVPLSLTATATDPDLPTNTLTFALVSGPVGLTVSPAGAINWTPGETNGPGTNTVFVRVFDNGSPGLSQTQSFQIVVNEVNVAPVLIVPPNTNIFTSAPYSATATATDADLPANALTFALISPPAGMTINPGSGLISWTPTEDQGPATNIIRVSVTDTNPPAVNAKSFSVTNSYTITVIKLCTLAITNQPVSRAAVTGAIAGFSVGATTAAGQTNYQWQFNGTNLIGQTARTLTISNVPSSGFGPYRVIVNDGTCSVTSNPAMLTLAVSPVFTNVQTSGTTLITSFATEFGPTYVVERKQDLGAPSWTLVTTYAGDGSPKTFTRPTQPLGYEFFRIRLE